MGGNAHPELFGGGTLALVAISRAEAMVNVCGVTMAMLQGKSRTPIPSNGLR